VRPPHPSATARAVLALVATVWLCTTVAWAVTGAGYYWPGWVVLSLVTPVLLGGSVLVARRRSERRALTFQVALSVSVGLVVTGVWALTGGDYFWPVWVYLGLAVALAAHVWVVPLLTPGRERELQEQVTTLTEARRRALEFQAAELQRVERDLHDGAQARLVSVGMTLGMAEITLADDPGEAGRLLAEARATVGDALADLRGLVRGILPPVLADRGLDGAVDALALSVPMPVTVAIDLDGAALSPPAESAAYFAVAEALANVVKHSGARSVAIRIACTDDTVSMEVEDDGVGGADPSVGTGLAGIARRLEALDGSVRLSSPPGGPTVVHMEVPCEPSSLKTSPS